MAAKKKVTKKVVTRKQSAAKTFKRPYNRKPKDDANTVPPTVAQLRDGEQEMPLNTLDNVAAINDSFEEFMNALSPPTLEDRLNSIEAIDMRGLSITDRFCVLSMLDSLNYLTSQGTSFINDMFNLTVALSNDVIILQNRNKLIDAGSWEAAEGLRFICKPSVNAHAHIGFSFPEAASAPPKEQIEINGALYQRIG